MEAVDVHREHLEQALDATNRINRPVDWILIATLLARHLQNRARYDEARTLFQKALAKAEQLVPPEPSLLAITLSNLGMVLHDLGDAAGARPLLVRALDIDEKTFDAEHPRVALRLSNLALALREPGDAAGAKPLLERALSVDEKTFGPKHPTVETHEFSVSKGRYKEAAFLLHQATERFYHCALLVLSAYKPKVHNIEDLGKRAGDLHPALRNVFSRGTPEDDRLFKLLKHAYVDARYDPKVAITREELSAIAVPVRELRSRVETVCRERIAVMDPVAS